MQKFHDKVVWITGASSGYGKALALAFAKAGAKVIISARREEQLHAIAAQQENLRALPLDLSQTATFPEKCQQAIAIFGRLDIVIHNGALAQKASALDTQPETARLIMEVDYFSYTELTRCLLPHFIANNSGHIVVVSGLLARITLPGRSSYAAAKAALFGYFGCLRAELVMHNIAVTMLIPGAMQTDLVANALMADGSVAGGQSSTSGCTVDIAARQSLDAIASQAFEACIGEDKDQELWQLSLQHPDQAIEMVLAQVKHQAKQV